LIAEASSALAHLDAAALEELGKKAEALASLDLGSSGVPDRAQIPVLEARFRVFAALLKATGENLAILQRAEAQESFGRDRFAVESFGHPGAPRGLFESFGMYDDRDVHSSIWPVGMAGNRKPDTGGTGQA